MAIQNCQRTMPHPSTKRVGQHALIWTTRRSRRDLGQETASEKLLTERLEHAVVGIAEVTPNAQIQRA